MRSAMIFLHKSVTQANQQFDPVLAKALKQETTIVMDHVGFQNLYIWNIE